MTAEEKYMKKLEHMKNQVSVLQDAVKMFEAGTERRDINWDDVDRIHHVISELDEIIGFIF